MHRDAQNTRQNIETFWLVSHANQLYRRLKTEESAKYLKCVKCRCNGSAKLSWRQLFLSISTAMHLKFVLHVMIAWTGAIRLAFIPVAAPATETLWAEARCKTYNGEQRAWEHEPILRSRTCAHSWKPFSTLNSCNWMSYAGPD